MKTLMQDHDQVLIEKAKAGDRSAFERLVEVSRARIEGVIQSSLIADVRHLIDVDEVLQETLVRAFESIQGFQWRGTDSFSAWLRGIARNVVVSAIRKKRPEHGIQIVDRAAADDVSPSTAARREERFDRLKESLAALKADHREVLMLSRIDGLPIREIANRMNRSPDAVKQLLSRALKALRATFGHTESLQLPDRNLRQEGLGHDD